jgi:hypothetical protein
MHTTLLATAAKLSDRELLRRVSALAGLEREATVELIAHLAEFDGRRLHRAEGYGSLFSYCTGALRLSEQAAYKRIAAARASRRFPMLLDRLADGSLNLSTLCLLAPHLTAENYEAVLAKAMGRNKREVEELVARIAPIADVPPSVRKLPGPALPARTVELDSAPKQPWFVTPGEPSARTFRGNPAAPVPPPTAPRPVVAPLAPERYRVQFTVGTETHKKLRRAQDLLRREIPDGNPGTIFDRALTLLLEDVARKKWAETANPRPSGGTTGTRSRHVPAEVKRSVWLRDGGRCAFVAKNGRRCTERAYIEFHHVEPYGIGGETTAANLSLRCRAHNAYEAERDFGPHVPVVRESPPVYAVTNGPPEDEHPNRMGSTRPGDS